MYILTVIIFLFSIILLGYLYMMIKTAEDNLENLAKGHSILIASEIKTSISYWSRISAWCLVFTAVGLVISTVWQFGP